jgi:hypothetical protein
VVLGEIEKASQRISTPRRPRLEQFKWELVQTSSGCLSHGETERKIKRHMVPDIYIDNFMIEIKIKS